MVEPGLVDVDAVFRLHRGGGEIVEGPHAFIGERAGCKADGCSGKRRDQMLSHDIPLYGVRGDPRRRPDCGGI